VTAPPDRKLILDDNRSFLERLKAPLHPCKRPLFVEMLTKAYEIPAALLNDIRIAAARPEILIKPRLDKDLKLEDFGRMDEAIEVGYEGAIGVLDAEGIGR